MNIKSKDEGTEGVPVENSLDNTIEVTQKRRSIETGRIKIGSPNEVLATQVLVVSDNVASWVWLNTLMGARRVWIFVTDPASWSFDWGWSEAIEVIGFKTIAIAIYLIGTDEWNYAWCLIQGG